MKYISAHIALLSSNLIWACAYPLYNFVMPKYIDPLPLFTATTIVTALLALVSIPFSGKATHRLEGRDIISVICAALLIAVLRKGMLLYGLSLTSSIDGSIIATISPVVVLVISVIVGFERLTWRKVVGMLFGFGGAVGVILMGGRGSHAESGMVGNILILICAFISAIYMIWFKSLLQRYEPMVLLRWMFIFSAAVVAPIGAKSLLAVDCSGWSVVIWLAVAYLVVMPTYLPNLLLTSGLKRVTPSVSSIYTYVQPVVAVIISVAIGLDKLTSPILLFALMIFVGVALVIRAPRRGDQ